MSTSRGGQPPSVTDNARRSPPAHDSIGRGSYGTIDWYHAAEAAEERGDWDSAIGLVAAHAECYSKDHHRHSVHLWHLRLLAVAGRLSELADLGRTDVHAARTLNTYLHEAGRAGDLRARADAGDQHARTHLVRLLADRGDARVGMATVERLAPGDESADNKLPVTSPAVTRLPMTSPAVTNSRLRSPPPNAPAQRNNVSKHDHETVRRPVRWWLS